LLSPNAFPELTVSQKCGGGQTAAPNSAEGAYSAPQNLLVGFEEVALRRRTEQEKRCDCERNGERERKEGKRKEK